jgi:mannitol-specific phosphotransferase system IIBC component
MNDHSFFAGTRTGTACGTLLVILCMIDPADLLQTTLVAAIGAAVSFLVTLLMKKIFRKRKK